jgi:hypothetical protein
MHYSNFANELRCYYCGKTQSAKEWPVRGDWVGFCWEDEPGEYSIKLTCPHCGKDWYVVWDDDPGPIETLTFAKPKGSG